MIAGTSATDRAMTDRGPVMAQSVIVKPGAGDTLAITP